MGLSLQLEAASTPNTTHGDVPVELHGIWLVVRNAFAASDKDNVLKEIFVWEISTDEGQGRITEMFWDFPEPYKKIVDDIHGSLSPALWFPDSKLLKELTENVIIRKNDNHDFAANQDYYVHSRTIPTQYKDLEIDPDLNLLIVNDIHSEEQYVFEYVNLYMVTEREHDLMSGGFRSRSKIGGQIREKEGVFRMYRVNRKGAEAK